MTKFEKIADQALLLLTVFAGVYAIQHHRYDWAFMQAILIGMMLVKRVKDNN